MAETDTSFAKIAERLEVSEGHVREWLMQYAEGAMPEADGMRVISFFMTSMGAIIDVRFIARAVEANHEARHLASDHSC